LRLHENRWTSGDTRFITEEMYEACLDREHQPVLPQHSIPLYVGVDIGIKHDSSAVVAVMRGQGRPTVALHRIWKPTANESVRLEDVVEYLCELSRFYRVKAVVADPNQMLGVIQRLREKAVPIQEYPQTTANLTQAGQVLFDLVRDKNLRLYSSADLRDHLINSVVVESPRGWRLAKDKASKKIDAAVALAMALVALQEKPEGFAPLVWSIVQDAGGNTWIGDELVTAGHRGMSKGYAGPNVDFVHPHERAVDMSSEWDARLGPKRAERMRRAWTDNTPVKPDAVDPYSACGRCGMRIPASFHAQHHRDSARCEGTPWLTNPPATPALRKAPTRPPEGAVGLQSTCQACEQCVFGSSLAELEAAEECHLADSERCTRWERERGRSETFKRGRRRPA
jgi:hypothetical protein